MYISDLNLLTNNNFLKIKLKLGEFSILYFVFKKISVGKFVLRLECHGHVL
jgi:hypothetical protein